MILCFFFFSSRRRHTRFDCDWSSDVCSSDLDHADLFFVHAIRPGADGEADDLRVIDCVPIEPAQIFRFRVSIGEGLKIDDELVGMESLSNVFDALPNLIANRICFDRGRRPERVVVAVSAAADRYSAVSIRTREPGVDDDLINSLAEFFLEPPIIGPESRLSPWEQPAG